MEEEEAPFQQAEIAAKWQTQGYRWSHLRTVKREYVVSQDTITHLIKFFDPEGAELRQVECLRLFPQNYI